MLNDQLVYIGLELVIACLAVAGNILVCWAVCRNSNLQSITNFFVVSLAVADIAVGLLAIPFAIAISTGFCAKYHGCLFIACFVLVLTQSSIFSLLAVAVDRYIAIKNPLRYNGLVTVQRAKGIIAFCWVLSVGIGLTPMLGWNVKSLNSTTPARNNSSCPRGMTECLFERVVSLSYMVYFNFFGFVLVPLMVMLVIYSHIFMVARHQLRLMGLKVAQTPDPGKITSPSSSSRTTLQKEVHAAKSLAIIVGFFALCWLPVHIINCFNHFCQNNRVPHWVMNTAIMLSHANSVVNPFIYAYRIREFRLTFRRILYQHILGQKDGHGFRVGNGDGRSDECSSVMRTSNTCIEGSSCGTMVNRYILDRALPKASCEASSHWTSTLDAAPSSYINNGNQIKVSTLSATQQPCITGFSAQDGVESIAYLGGTTDVFEVRDNESCISFVNVQALSPTQTSSARSKELTEIS